VKSTTTDAFWSCYAELPKVIRKQARGAYQLFLRDSHYPSLHFKRVHSTRSIYSVRITRDYRALGILHKDEIIWFWIGSHLDYEKILRKSGHA
jgi:hypothetical protein